jgi:hypothetical protein
LASAVHASSIIDIVTLGVFDRATQIVHSLKYLAIVFALIYAPLFFVSDRYFALQEVARGGRFLQSGDVLLASKRAYRNATPRAGDVVTYELRTVFLRGNVQGRHKVQYEVGGIQIDRILAVAGQKVIADGALYVDGIESHARTDDPGSRDRKWQRRRATRENT